MSTIQLSNEAEALAQSSVLIVGVGGLGCPAALALARSGIGRIGLADPDRVELSNLHRQLLHTDADVGRPKVDSGAEALRRESPTLLVESHPLRVGSAEAAALLSRYDVTIDATDQPDAKLLLNDVAVGLGKPLVYGGAIGFVGQLMTIRPGHSACLRCLFPEAPAADEAAGCSDAGVLGPLPAVIGALQAREALALLGVGGSPLEGLLSYDARSLRFREIPVRPNPDCPVCRATQPLPGPRSAGFEKEIR